MGEKSRDVLTKEQMLLELQLIINRRLYERNVIDRATYEATMSELLKNIQKYKTV